MYNSYADILESYMIAEEASFKDAVKGFGAGVKAGIKESAPMVAIATAVIAALSAKGLYDKYKNTKESKNNIAKSGGTISSNSSSNDKYRENTKNVISKMRAECPDVIEKELSLRKSELLTLKKCISAASKKYKIGGFDFTTEEIDKMLNNDESAWGTFLKVLLPEKSPKLSGGYNKYEWCEDITIVDCDIYEWNKEERKNAVNVREWEETEEYTDTIGEITKEFTSVCSRLKCGAKADYYGDWDDGPIVVLLKPSDEFIKVAKSYGWHE